jgi:hypothetical protein
MAGWRQVVELAMSNHDVAELTTYMRGSRVKKFFRDQHFFLSVSRGLAQAQFCI